MRTSKWEKVALRKIRTNFYSIWILVLFFSTLSENKVESLCVKIVQRQFSHRLKSNVTSITNMIQSRYASNLTRSQLRLNFYRKKLLFLKKCISYFPTTEIAFVSLLFLLLFMTLWSEPLPRIVIVLPYLTFLKETSTLTMLTQVVTIVLVSTLIGLILALL